MAAMRLKKKNKKKHQGVKIYGEALRVVVDLVMG